MKSWSKRFAAVCATSLLVCLAAAQSPKPAVALVDPADATQWRKWTQEVGWQLIGLTVTEGTPMPMSARKTLPPLFNPAIKDATADAAHTYLAGRTEAAAAVFYTISRVPDLWAAGLALGGSPKPALDTGRVFAANFTNTPVLWISDGAGDAELAAQLKSAGLNLERHIARNLTIAQVFAALLQHTRAEFPNDADCETNSPKFARCYWMEPTKFDAAERNEVLPPKPPHARFRRGPGPGRLRLQA